MIYLLKVCICSALFFALYLLVFKKLTFFRVNRFYLLFTLVLSFVIPALQLTIKQEVDQIAFADQGFILKDAPDRASGIQAIPLVETQNQLDWKRLVPFLYGTIVTALLLLMVWRIVKLFKHVGTKPERLNGLKLVSKQSGFTNCSFFNYVFIDRDSLSADELAILLKHEEVHAKQLHSVDKLLLMLAKAVLWFNPIVYLYDKELEQVHEYEADEATSNGIGAKHYAHLLLKLAVAKSSAPLIHNFVKSPVKERIKMLFNAKSTQMKKMRYLLLVPVIASLAWCFTISVVHALPKKPIEVASVRVKPYQIVPKVEIPDVLAQEVVPVAMYEVKKQADTPPPKLISSSRATVDTKANISYIKKGIMEIFGYVLTAEDIVWDSKNGIITAGQASLKAKDGTTLTTETIVFDLKKGTYKANPQSGHIQADSKDDLDLMKRLKYNAKDSISTSKTTGVITLYGNAKVEIDGYVIEAKKIELDRINTRVRGYDASITIPNEGTSKVKQVDFDLKTKQGVVYGVENIKH